MIFYTNFFINCMNSISTSSTNFILECRFLFGIINKLLLSGIFMVLIIEYGRAIIKSHTDEKILTEKIPKIALKYYKDKYNREIYKHSINLDYSLGVLYAIKYNGSGYVYIDDKKSKYIYVELNSKLELINIYDNIEDDIILRDMKSALSDIEEKYNVNCFIKLYKAPYNKEQYCYTNINEYFTKNSNINPIIFVVHKAEIEDYRKYCGNYAKELYTILSECFAGINIELGMYFTKDNCLHKKLLSIIDEYIDYENSSLSYFLSDNENYLMKNDDYYYYVFD